MFVIAGGEENNPVADGIRPGDLPECGSEGPKHDELRFRWTRLADIALCHTLRLMTREGVVARVVGRPDAGLAARCD